MPVVLAVLVVVQCAFAILLRCKKGGALASGNRILNIVDGIMLEIMNVVGVDIEH